MATAGMSMRRVRTQNRRPGLVWAAAGLVVAVVGAVLLVVSRSPANVGTAKEIQSSVEVRSGAGAAFKSVKEHPSVKAGDVVRTSEDGLGEIDYGDGSVTRLDSSTTFTVDRLLTTGKRVVRASLSEGRVWSKVNKLSGSDDRFEVRTPNATATVRGTIFVCEATSSENGLTALTPELFETTCMQITGNTDVVWDNGAVGHMGPGECMTNGGPCKYTPAQLIAMLSKFADLEGIELPWKASKKDVKPKAEEKIAPRVPGAVAGVVKELQPEKEPAAKRPSVENHDDDEDSDDRDDRDDNDRDPSLDPGSDDDSSVTPPSSDNGGDCGDDGDNGHGNSGGDDCSNPGGG